MNPHIRILEAHGLDIFVFFSFLLFISEVAAAGIATFFFKWHSLVFFLNLGAATHQLFYKIPWKPPLKLLPPAPAPAPSSPAFNEAGNKQQQKKRDTPLQQHRFVASSSLLLKFRSFGGIFISPENERFFLCAKLSFSMSPSLPSPYLEVFKFLFLWRGLFFAVSFCWALMNREIICLGLKRIFFYVFFLKRNKLHELYLCFFILLFDSACLPVNELGKGCSKSFFIASLNCVIF